MPENVTAPVSTLASEYTTKVTADLEHNEQEQERVNAEIASLQQRLTELQQDHAVLVNMREALSLTPPQTSALTAPATTSVPAPRKKPSRSVETGSAPSRSTVPRSTLSGSGRAKQSRRKKPAAVTSPANANATSQTETPPKAKGKTATQTAPAATADKKAGTQPTLVDLVHEHLTGTNEPRSATEITAALSETHPQRSIKTTVVRNTLENLVAKGRAERSKQGSAVYYTAASKTPEEPSEQSSETSSAANGKNSEAAAPPAQTG
ncbi:hypothetical protein [Streptomyces lavenduligriseus]|uniref:Regulatory protein n=1 Tax=Streptomyces lavenduligriseus TaxID=67315 RepID=A0ABT0P4R1_9ACTN|nr:hypothetical protein [Streptomyces lavenduligriseus]MCL3998734.1 hypothetical protein [Streptomyces lavenduligriseus]